MKRSEIKRKTPLVAKRLRPKTVIRQLRPGEDAPPGEPRRYPDGRGYVRLRWLVGPYEYVEVYEHRLLAGVPDAHVHHLDEVKANNSPENLEVLSRREHALRHAAESRSKSRSVSQWGGLHSQEDFDRRQRRIAREAGRKEFLDRIAGLYAEGISTTEIGLLVGRDSSVISRGLRAAGVVPDKPVNRRPSGQVSYRVRQLVHARSQMRCERCGKSVLWGGGQVHHRKPRKMGGSRQRALHEASNLLHLCVECHGWVESHRTEALANGWAIRQSDDPLLVPVAHWLHGVVFLDAVGGWTHTRPSTSPPRLAAANDQTQEGNR